MRVYPPQLDIGEEEGFTPEKDLFGRADLGRQMSSLVATVEDPLVIAFEDRLEVSTCTANTIVDHISPDL